jgi:hypothetical protein
MNNRAETVWDDGETIWDDGETRWDRNESVSKPVTGGNNIALPVGDVVDVELNEPE